MRVCVFCVDEIYFSPRSRPGCIVAWTLLFTAICVFEGVWVQGESVCDVVGGVEVGEVLIAAPQ